MDYPGWNGFLGTRASLMLDVVFLAMFAVLPVLAFSVWLVRYRKQYLWHKRIQLTLGAILAVAVTLFEIDMRIYGWQERADLSPYFDLSTGTGGVITMLWIHLAAAVSTAVLWIVVIAGALRRFANPPQPGAHSPSHRLWGWLAAIDMGLTGATGWIFYWMAFAAT